MHTGDAVEVAGHDAHFFIAQTGVEGAGGGVALVGVHAQGGAVSLAAQVLVEVYEAGGAAPALIAGVHHQGVEDENGVRGVVPAPGGVGLDVHLRLVDLGGGDDAALFLGHIHVSGLDGVGGGLAGGVDGADPADGGAAGFLLGVDGVVDGGDLIQVAGDGLAEHGKRLLSWGMIFSDFSTEAPLFQAPGGQTGGIVVK